MQIAISEAATNWQPDAAATPSTHAIIGIGQSIIEFIRSVAKEKIFFWFSESLYNITQMKIMNYLSKNNSNTILFVN